MNIQIGFQDHETGREYFFLMADQLPYLPRAGEGIVLHPGNIDERMFSGVVESVRWSMGEHGCMVFVSVKADAEPR